MQGRLPLLEARHAAIEGFRILLHQILNQIQVSDTDRRKDVVARAALDEERHHVPRIFVRRAIESCPADDVELVHVAEAVDVAAGIEQRARSRGAPSSGPVQRVGVVTGLACVWIRAVLEQQAYGIHVPTPGSGVQSRCAEPIGFP